MSENEEEERGNSGGSGVSIDGAPGPVTTAEEPGTMEENEPECEGGDWRGEGGGRRSSRGAKPGLSR